ncbi:extracellular solute-binding protein [Thermobacillus sp. ZCTH02-B1]|uniref:ABC transporter substrate-binding protein n=1 Tax=Thermobacillus sp. ZCTH02-B1 TaxID=1858795 RepID=UPI0025EC864D|nr:extracellular solute-binding protein [Thermobacillus sp. ZCTH02-B1]
MTVAAESWMVEKLFVQQAVDKFNAAHPEYTVELVPYADPTVLSSFALQWAKGETDADVVIIDGTSNAVQFMARDLIINFNETNFFEGKTAKENFVGNVLSFGAYNDFQFAIPFALEAYAFNANKAMFADAGLTDANGNIIPPANWEEVLEYARKMHKDGKTGMTLQWGPNALYTMIATEQAARGSFYDDEGVLTFDTPEMRQILEIWKKGRDEGVFSIDTYTNKDAGRNNYKAGQVGILFESGSRAPEAAPTIGAENATVFGAPGMETNGSFAFSAGIIVPRASKAQDLAIKFIQEALMDEEVQANAASVWGKLPVIAEYFDKIDAEWKTTLYNIIEKSVTSPFYRDFPVIYKETPVLLQFYLNGELSLDDFIKQMEDMIANAGKEIS